jgi:hypothetical protein
MGELSTDAPPRTMEQSKRATETMPEMPEF